MSHNDNNLKGLGDVGRGLFGLGSSTGGPSLYAGLGSVGSYGQTPNTSASQPSNAQLAAVLKADIEINTSERMKHLAGKLMHHPEQDVRDLAALALRHVERREDGK